MRSCHEIEPQLSLLVDGLVADEAQADVMAHVRECPSCRGLLTDLERLRASARSLGPMAPPSQVWQRIDAGIRLDPTTEPDRPARSTSRTTAWQWIGLAAALLLVTTVVYMVRGRPGSEPGDGNAATASSVEGMTDELGRATVPYETAIRDLQAMTAGREDAIAPGAVAVIDTAIADSRAALTENPDSESARDSLFEALRRKIGLLQTTVSLINDMRAGNQEGAAEAAGRLGKQS